MRALERIASMRRLNLATVKETMAICRMEPHECVPVWVTESPFYAITKTDDELSLVCPQHKVPRKVEADRNWRCLKIQGPMALSQTGVLASLTGPLADARVSVFVISTFDTDYLLIKKKNLLRAIEILRRSGHFVSQKLHKKKTRIKS